MPSWTQRTGRASSLQRSRRSTRLAAKERARLGPEEGLFELGGAESTWIWAHTCSMPRCGCRSALILWVPEGREKLLARGAVVHDAWNVGDNYVQRAVELNDVVSFDLDIDTARASRAGERRVLDLDAHPEVRGVVERIDADILDAIGRLWYRGKGLVLPDLGPGEASELRDVYRHGDMVPFLGVRRDMYVFGDRVFEAIELYCPSPECTCGQVRIAFDPVVPRGAPKLGTVVVQRSGATKLEPSKNGRERLEQLWAAYRLRHPRFLQHVARREARMKECGRLLHQAPPPAPATSIGRNAPCPCGSGNKYKKCCGSAARVRDKT